MSLSEERTFQTLKTAGTKALRQECAGHVWGTAGRSMWLDQNEGWERELRKVTQGPAYKALQHALRAQKPSDWFEQSGIQQIDYKPRCKSNLGSEVLPLSHPPTGPNICHHFECYGRVTWRVAWRPVTGHASIRISDFKPSERDWNGAAVHRGSQAWNVWRPPAWARGSHWRFLPKETHALKGVV